MPKNRFFVSQPLKCGECVTLGPEESRHTKVMRLEEGASLELVNGKGYLAEGVIFTVARSETVVKVTSSRHTPDDPFAPCLIQAFPRHTHLDSIIEKAVELGVREIWLFPGMRSEKLSVSESGYRRLLSLAISAMKQCGGLYLPTISLHPPLLEWATLPNPTLYGAFHPKAPKLQTVISKLQRDQAPYILIGPEAGLSNEEISHLNALGATGVTLHPNILRTETAGPFAIGLSVHMRMNENENQEKRRKG